MFNILGPIIGHTTATTSKIWVKLFSGVNCFINVFAEDKFLFSQILKPSMDEEYTCVFELENLTPGTLHKIIVGSTTLSESLNGKQGKMVDSANAYREGSFTTQSKEQKRFRFAIGSCRSFNFDSDLAKGDRTFKHISDVQKQLGLDAVFMIGDQIYTDSNKFNSLKTFAEISNEYSVAFSQPYIAKLMANCPTYMMLDDHEITNNWSMDMLQTKQVLYSNAMKAYRIYQHAHNPNTTNSYYYSFATALCAFFITDCRNHRLVNPQTNDAKTLLGSLQLNALLLHLEKNKHLPIQFVTTSAPIALDVKIGHGKDGWQSYDSERQQIFSFIEDKEIKNVVFLSGDIHNSAFSQIKSTKPKSEFSINSLTSSAFYNCLGRGYLYMHKYLYCNEKNICNGNYSYTNNTKYMIGRNPNFLYIDIDTASNKSKAIAQFYYGMQLVENQLHTFEKPIQLLP